VATATIPAGGRSTVNVFYTGGQAQAFSAILRIVACLIDGEGRDKVDIPFHVQIKQ
jgi:hypothetical protein